MDKEVEDILSGDSDSEDDGDGGVAGGSEASESEDSLTGVSRGHKRKLETILEDEVEDDSQLESPRVKFRNGEELPSDFDVDQASDDSGDDGEDQGDWSLMGAALEKELE